ncbi:MAG TPA: peptide chain release factor N(5)-glutamine methyltransferase [Pyrinomonadaceae bacterium]|nr:peptide chain release factor N(5)-glutamine methyltransferase [Pyrinomonadaceae bacterium]
MNISEYLKNASEILLKSEIAEARRDANTLLGFVLQKDRTFLIAHSEYELTESEQTRFDEAIERRAKREPLQHITGKQEFFGLEFEVNKDVLIPRPETELIVENALEILKNLENSRFCEVGVGSGCISISILHENKNASGKGLDISEKALKVAKRNAEKHQVSERFDLQISDVFEVLKDEKFDIIVSNPPYISMQEIQGLDAEVKDFEPLNALTDGNDGFSIIVKIIRESPKFLKPKGFLLMEIGFGQAEEVLKMIDEKNWSEVEIVADLQNIPRMLKTRRVN